jgi:excisionase family DNA binding protein
LETKLENRIYTIPQAADKLQLHPNTIRNLITRGDLKADRIGRSIRITSENLEALLTPFAGGEFGVWK